MLWYADNSELKGVRESDVPDMLLFGGLAVSAKIEPELRVAVEAVKKKYFHSRAPVKWNFKDLLSLYESHNWTAQYQEMLSASKEWRKEIFEVVNKFECTVIVSIVQSHSVKKKVIKDVRSDLARYSFSNGLMRLGLHVSEHKPDRCQIFLDWPEKGDSNPFDQEYAAAYHRGRTADQSVRYHCGPLKGLNFADSVGFGNMRYSTMLQVADLTVGATRDFIECAIGKRDDSLGLHLCKIIAPRFRGFKEEKVFGRGISVASGDLDFKKRISEFTAKHLCGN